MFCYGYRIATRRNALNVLENKNRGITHPVRKQSDEMDGEKAVPGLTSVTPSPTLSTMPAPSCPKIDGNTPSGSCPPKV